MSAKRYQLWSGILIICFFQSSVASATSFPDMQDQWFRYNEAVDYLVNKKVIQGYPDTTFKPDQSINRAEFLKIVFKGKSEVQPVQRRCFSDVNPDEWYAPYVCAAKRRGIVQGYANGTFQPGKVVNTAEAIKMLLNAYNLDVQEGSGEHWYRPFVSYLDDNDILGEHSYTPWEDLSRVRAADLLWRVLRYDEEQFIPRYSKGCGKATPANALSGNFLLTIPSSYVIHDPSPLLVAFHGRTNNNAQVRSYYTFDKEAGDAFIAYPAARKNGNGTFMYEEEEVVQFENIVERIANAYCIDMDRIFVTGHSLGGWFANKISCLHGDVIRGSASLGSSGYRGNCKGPAAAMIIHNPNDRLAAFGGSVIVRDERIEQNNCSLESNSTSPQSFKCKEYEGCSINPVHFCPHEQNTDSRNVYYPHNWPRDTGRYIWEFFTSLQ